MQYAVVTGLVIGVVEFIKRLFDRDYRAACIIFGAALVGGVCGYFKIQGIDVPTGIIIGLGASGLVTIASKVSTGSSTVTTSVPPKAKIG